MINAIIQIDSHLVRISLEAEQRIKPRGNTKWSPDAIKCQKECVQLRYQKQLEHKSGNIRATKALKKQIQNKSRELEDLIMQQTNTTLKNLNLQLEELPSSEDQGIKRKRAKIKQQIRIIHEKTMYDKIKMETGKIKPITTPKIEVPIGDTIKTVTDPDEIAEAIRDANVTHFAQAHGCALTSSGYQNIWNREQFNNININSESIEWKLRENIRQINVKYDEVEIGMEEWKQKFKSWRESTSTSPSGVHLGHFKALIEPIYVIHDIQLAPDLEINNMQQEIMELHLRLINLILQSGNSIPRWQQCNNISIPKKPDCILLDKFRNIHIYECNLNAVLAIKWKAAIHNAEDANQLSESQFGSRKGKNTQIPILMEVLQQDISRLTRRPYGQINYDAKACYDRILPNLASIVSNAFGCSRENSQTSQSSTTQHELCRHDTGFTERMEFLPRDESTTIWNRSGFRKQSTHMDNDL